MSLLDAIMKPQEKTIRIACEGSMFVRLEELNELQTYKNLTDEAYQKAKTSIIELGFSFPIFVWENEGKMWIIDAHQRKRVLTRLRDVEGYVIPPLPAVRIHAKDKTEAKKKILAQESQYGDITEEGLYEFMNEEGFELDETELETFVDIDEFNWEQEASEVTEDEAPEVSQEPAKSELGKVYQLGRHRLMCGDATSIEDVELLMDGQKADMVFTDPPYGMNLDTEYVKNDIVKGNSYDKVIGDDKDFDYQQYSWIDCKEQFWWGADYYATTLPNKGSWFVWDKKKEGLDESIGSGFEICWSRIPHKKEMIRILWSGFTAKERNEARTHPTQKPIQLCSWFINKYSQPEQKIIDLFGGSGSTLIACEQTNRVCYMMELDCRYVDVIRKRYAKLLYPDRWEAEWEELTPSVESSE